MDARAAAEFARWKMDCACSEAACRFGRAWLCDTAIAIDLRYAVAISLLLGEPWH